MLRIVTDSGDDNSSTWPNEQTTTSHSMMTRSAKSGKRNPPTIRQEQTSVERMPEPVDLVYKIGTVVGDDKESIQESIFEFNGHPAIQSKCVDLERAGSKYLRLTSSHGTGRAARRNIPKGTELCCYIGVIYDATHNPAGNHSIEMGLCGETRIYVNASQLPHGLPLGRSMHMANHSCDPNCAVKYYVPDGWNHDLVLFMMVASRDIVKKEDVTFEYKGTMWQLFSTLPPIAPEGFQVIKCGCKDPCPNKLGRLDVLTANYCKPTQEHEEWVGEYDPKTSTLDSDDSSAEPPLSITVQPTTPVNPSFNSDINLKFNSQSRTIASLEPRQETLPKHIMLKKMTGNSAPFKMRGKRRLGVNLNDDLLLQQQKAFKTLRTSSPQMRQETLLHFLVDHTNTRHSSERIHSEERQSVLTAALNMAPTLVFEIIPKIRILADAPILVLDSDEEKATTDPCQRTTHDATPNSDTAQQALDLLAVNNTTEGMARNVHRKRTSDEQGPREQAEAESRKRVLVELSDQVLPRRVPSTRSGMELLPGVYSLPHDVTTEELHTLASFLTIVADHVTQEARAGMEGVVTRDHGRLEVDLGFLRGLRRSDPRLRTTGQHPLLQHTEKARSTLLSIEALLKQCRTALMHIGVQDTKQWSYYAYALVRTEHPSSA